MKTLKTLALSLLMVTSLSAFAYDQSANEKLNLNYALNAYLDAVAHGKINGLEEVLHQDVKFTSSRGKSILNFNKAQMLNYLKQNEHVEQNCQTEYSMIESNATLSVVKVLMKYEGFSKTTYLSLANTGKGWKITNASSSFE